MGSYGFNTTDIFHPNKTFSAPIRKSASLYKIETAFLFIPYYLLTSRKNESLGDLFFSIQTLFRVKTGIMNVCVCMEAASFPLTGLQKFILPLTANTNAGRLGTHINPYQLIFPSLLNFQPCSPVPPSSLSLPLSLPQPTPSGIHFATPAVAASTKR